MTEHANPTAMYEISVSGKTINQILTSLNAHCFSVPNEHEVRFGIDDAFMEVLREVSKEMARG